MSTQPDTPPKSCCTPSAARAPLAPRPDAKAGAAQRGPAPGLFDKVDIPGGAGLLGTAEPKISDDGEGPLRRGKVKPFRIGRTAVTNAQFAAFIEDTGYVTEAERYGWSFVFWDQVPKRVGDTRAIAGLEWWRQVEGATWRDINGPGSFEEVWRADHPAVQLSWNDAQAFAKWAGGRLPSEAEWEHAARGGLGDVAFPWGDALPDDEGFFPCNIWQGDFPQRNSAADGYAATAPAQSFAPNGYGLYNMAGNVWEWTGDAYRVKSLKKQVRARLKDMAGFKLSKGGSYLCHASYCFRYRIAARTGSAPDSTTTHHGFRMVWPMEG
ncbi:MAG: formylglycine-generating enzyme family protein [Sulfitobacter sp.]